MTPPAPPRCVGGAASGDGAAGAAAAGGGLVDAAAAGGGAAGAASEMACAGCCSGLDGALAMGLSPPVWRMRSSDGSKAPPLQRFQPLVRGATLAQGGQAEFLTFKRHKSRILACLGERAPAAAPRPVCASGERALRRWSSRAKGPCAP